MHDAAVLCMLLLLVLFSGIEGRSSKLSNICVYIHWYVLGGAAERGVAGGAMRWCGEAFGTEARVCLL